VNTRIEPHLHRMVKPAYDERMKQVIGRAYQEAAKSPDPSTQVGAVLIGSPQTIASGMIAGCNRLPRGFSPDDPRLEDREWKYRHIVHAEKEVVYRAASEGFPTTGAWMVAPFGVCTGCAKAIVQARIGHVVVHKQVMARTPDRWVEDILNAYHVLEAGGVTLWTWSGTVWDNPQNATNILIDGVRWVP
jgi:deoxycytidylate deaminase